MRRWCAFGAGLVPLVREPAGSPVNRRTLGAATISLVVLSSAIGWVAGSRIRSPAEVASRTAAPTAAAILVPVEERVLSTDIVTRGTARFGAPQIVSVTPSGWKPDASLITSLPAIGTEVNDGDVLITTSGRPVFLVAGKQPAFRDMGPGVEGDDVRQLEEALGRFGYDPGPVDGVYDASTGAAVALWYADVNFAPFQTTDVQLSVITSLERDLSLATLDVRGAQDGVATARADLLAAQAANSAVLAGGNGQTVDAVRRKGAATNRRAQLEVDAKQAVVDQVKSGTPASAAEIDAAKRDLTRTQAAVEPIRSAGLRAVAAAKRAVVEASVSLTLARSEAVAANLGAQADLINKQTALGTLLAELAVGPAKVDALRRELTFAQAAVETVRLTGVRAVAAAQNAAPEDLIIAQSEADAANLGAQADLINKQTALGVLLAELAVVPAKVDALRRELTFAQAAVETVRLTGVQAVSTAQQAVDVAPKDLVTAESEAVAANLAGQDDVAGKQAMLDVLLAPAHGSAAEVRVAQADLDLAVLNLESTRLAGEQALAAASSGSLQAEIAAAAAQVAAAQTVAENAGASLATRTEQAAAVALELDILKLRSGTLVPADELVFVANAPVRVAEAIGATGEPAAGPVLAVTNSVVAIDSSLPLEEVPLIAEGMSVVLDEPLLGINATGTVSRLAATPGTDGVDGFHVYFEILVDEAPPGLVGSSVRITIPVESSGGAVRAVPVSALSMTADGSSRVQKSVGGALEFVAVEPGLSAKGYVGITPIGGTLDIGDLVVVGFDGPVAPAADVTPTTVAAAITPPVATEVPVATGG